MKVLYVWPQEPKTLEFERDFVVKDINGDIIIKAVSTWIILDIQSRRIKRSSTITLKYPSIIKGRVIDCKLGKLNPSGELELAYNKVIGYSDIDFNGHLNNSKYIDFIMDCFPIENHKIYSVKSIEVNFINEALPGDSLLLYRDTSLVNNNIIYIEGINERVKSEIFKARVEIEEIAKED